jgi:hypothetical protein
VASIGTPLLAPRLQKPAGARGRDPLSQKHVYVRLPAAL